MADILIRGMEIPKEGGKILIAADGSVWVNAWTRGHMRMENVYAVPLPEGHGRLIDADALQEEFKKSHDGKRLMLIDTAPTIVPAEGEDTGGE